MVKDKYGCMIKEVGDELLSLCLDSLRVSAAGRRLQVDSCLPFLPLLSPSVLPRHAAPVLVAMVTRASRAMRGRDAGRKTERGEKGEKREGSGGILSSISVIQREEGVPSCSAAFR